MFYNYSIEEIYNQASGVDDQNILQIRKKVKSEMYERYSFDRKRSDDLTCQENSTYFCNFGSWRKYDRKSLGGIPQPYGARKFKTLNMAQKYACDKGFGY